MATILVVALLLCSIEGYSPARGHEDYPGSDSVREESRRRLTAGVHAGIGSYGPPRLTGTIGYSRNNLNVYGYGSVDMNRNYGFGVGFNYRFKRNIQVNVMNLFWDIFRDKYLYKGQSKCFENELYK